MKSAKAARRAPGAAAKPAPAARAWWPWLAILAAAFAAALLAYGPALDGPFVLDDVYLPFMAPSVNPALAAWVGGVRPVLMFSYWLNYRWGGQDPGAYHLLNVILHVLGSGLIYAIVRRILEWAKTDASRRGLLALFAAGLFLLHPLQTESVSYVASRSEVLSVLFFNAAFAVFLYRRRTEASWPTVAGVLALALLAALTKEHTVVLPALLLATDYYWNPGFSFSGIRKNWRLYVPVAAAGAAGGVLVLRFLRANPTAGFGVREFTWYQYLFTQCRAFWLYVRLFFLPFGQNADPDFPVSKTVFDHGALFGLLALVAAAAAAWIYRRKYPLASYGFVVFVLLLAPTSSVVPIRDVVAERRVYLPFLGLLLPVLEILRRWKTSRGAMAGALAAVLLFAGALTYRRNLAWGGTISLWQDTVRKSPNKYRPHFQLAYALYQQGQCVDAVSEFARTAALAPPDYRLLVDWAEAEDCARDYDRAIAKLRQAALLHPSAHVFAELGKVYGRKGDFQKAMEPLEQARQLDPNYDMTYVYRGMAYQSLGDPLRARADYLHALELNPANPLAPGMLANLDRGSPPGRR